MTSDDLSLIHQRAQQATTDLLQRFYLTDGQAPPWWQQCKTCGAYVQLIYAGKPTGATFCHNEGCVIPDLLAHIQAQQEQIARLEQEREFQRARADKWVAISERKFLEIEQLKESQ